ncbi:ABC transporter permease [Oceanobacillus piezotolerans]|uniref:ABC transporter permease n=1 Tax=Oceanobacillus piezotolerans TaxID=2448030 RepID=A0A498D542_9BACI|nr:ABC transporter permease [Oceanobacillus piezotolerans]RLL43966.1 ABC transporter permease [Oceanobacillus piezotolerans]
MKKIGNNTLNIILGVLIILAIWQITVMITDIEEALLPTPVMVWEAIVSLVTSGALFEHLKVSLGRFAVGYIAAAILAVILGLFLGRMDRLWAVLDPIVQVLRPVAPIAWSPFIVLWFGIGNAPAIVIIFIAAFFPILLTTVSGVKNVDTTYLKLASNLEIKQPQLMTKIIFPAAFPAITSGLHIGVGTAWIFLVSGEMVGAQSGLGYLIVDARNLLRLDLVLAGIIFIGVCGLLIDRAIRLLERWVEMQWGMSSKE